MHLWDLLDHSYKYSFNCFSKQNHIITTRQIVVVKYYKNFKIGKSVKIQVKESIFSSVIIKHFPFYFFSKIFQSILKIFYWSKETIFLKKTYYILSIPFLSQVFQSQSFHNHPSCNVSHKIYPTNNWLFE